MIDSYLGKKYKLTNSDNFDEFMKVLEVGYVTRKAGLLISPVISLTKEGDRYVLTSNSTFKNMTTKFTPGIEFEDVTPDGRKVKSTITIQGNTLVEVHRDENGRTSTFERTFTNTEVTLVCKAEHVVCTRIYKLIE